MRVDVKLLRHQHQFVTDWDSTYLALVGGYGSGKTRALVLKLILLASKNPGCDLALLGPTNSMTRDVVQAELDRQLHELNLAYDYRASPLPVYTLRFSNGESRLLLRSAENYRRLLGLNLAGFGVDELDSIPDVIATAAWRVLMSRLRAGRVRQGVCVTTPEGFRFCHRFWIKEAASDRKLVRAKTRDNPFLPEGYIESLLNSFPPQLINAYLNGEFTNLNQGRVYPNFDRLLNTCTDVVGRYDHLHIGIDFNVGKMAGVVHLVRDGQPRAIDEFVGLRDTPELIQAVEQRYPEQVWRGQISVYPDATGAARDSTNASESDIGLLRQAGFRVVTSSSNPKVRDRVLAMNALFCNAKEERRYRVNVNRCPDYTEALEQQTYTDKGEPDKEHGFDHCVDAAGYYIHRGFGIKARGWGQGAAVWSA